MTVVKKLEVKVPDSGKSRVYTFEYRNVVLGLIIKALELLNHVDGRPERQQLLAVISKILSASKMEDHPEVLIIAEHMRSVVEALISGRIILSRQALTNIQNSLEQVRDGLENDCVIFEPSLVEKLKGILSTSKSDEKDYLFLKKIRVLLIDDDEFAQFNISRNIGPSDIMHYMSTPMKIRNVLVRDDSSNDKKYLNHHTGVRF